MTRYEAKVIYRPYDRDIDKGDVGYLTWKERPETLVRGRFYLEDVSNWQEYKDVFERYDIQDKKSVLEVCVSTIGGKTILHIVEDLDVFDLLMEHIEKEVQS